MKLKGEKHEKIFLVMLAFSGGKINKLVDPKATVRIPKVKRRKPLRPAKETEYNKRRGNQENEAIRTSGAIKVIKSLNVVIVSEFRIFFSFNIFYFCSSFSRKTLWMEGP